VLDAAAIGATIASGSVSNVTSITGHLTLRRKTLLHLRKGIPVKLIVFGSNNMDDYKYFVY
jgi:hypothetical protein